MFIIGNLMQTLIISKNRHKVCQRFTDSTILIKLQLCLPIHIITIIKIIYCLQFSFLSKLQLHLLILNCKINHSFKRRHLRRRSIWFCFVIQCSVLMNPYNIKRIHKLTAGRIRRMMTIRKLVIINNNPCTTVCRYIIVSSRHSWRLINIRNKRINGFLDRICSTKGSNHSFFF